jgi:hypothetical protein
MRPFLAALACLSSLASAAEPAPPSAPLAAEEEARGQRELAKELFAQQRYEDALGALKEANRLAPGANIVLTIADAYRYLGVREERTATALKDPTDKAQSTARAETLFREALNWIEQCGSLPMTEADRRDADALRDEVLSKVALVEIATEPEGAQVFVDGRSEGTRKSIAVSPGEHRFSVKVPGYRGEERTVIAAVGARRSLRFLLERLHARVQIETRPPGAKIALEPSGELLGSAPLTVSMSVSRHRVTAALEGYLPQTRELEVAPDVGASLVLELQRDPATVATLSVSGSPAGASVLLDGRLLGQVPFSAPSLEPGSGGARLSIAAPGHIGWSDVVALQPGAATKVRVELPSAPRPLPTIWKWLGYGGGGAFVLAGAGFGVWALRERASFDGDPSRSRLRATDRLNTTADILVGAGLTLAATTAVAHLLSAAARTARADVSLER